MNSSASPSVASSPTGIATSASVSPDLSARPRISSMDVARGLVMVLMAIDHVRVFSGVPAGGPTPGIFFTRWITHFVAPAFAFFAGTGAYLYGRRIGNRAALAKFLWSRGAFLILLELTVIRVCWTFNFDFRHYLLAGVIWMLGWCMILMAALIWLPLRPILAFGLAVVGLHNIMDYFMPLIAPKIAASVWAPLAQIVYFGGSIQLGNGPSLEVLYSIIPWIGVMACGYAFGRIMELPDATRRRYCFALGASAIALFLVLRGFDLYGDPRPWNHPPKRISVAAKPQQPAGATAQNSAAPPNGKAATQPSTAAATPAPPPRAATPKMSPVLRMLNTAKYPASLSFLLMTLGPMLLMVALSDYLPGKFTGWLRTFGRVPLFFYLLHIPLIHGLALAVSLVRTPSATWWLFANHPMLPPPPPTGYMWSLGLLYAVWAIAILCLYFPCRWYADLKARSRSRWLSYL
jgi:uncharacterized membrane protein